MLSVLRQTMCIIATASVDFAVDKMIQDVLKTQFPNTTILCIAHRVATLVWMDSIVVMEDGKIVEQGSPKDLLIQTGTEGVSKANDGKSKYRALMRETGDEFLKEMVQVAQNARR